MTKGEYKIQIRINRGKLTKMDNELEDIYDCGSDNLLAWSLLTKGIGVTKISTIATSLSIDEQDDFVSWVHENKRSASDIEMKLLELI